MTRQRSLRSCGSRGPLLLARFGVSAVAVLLLPTFPRIAPPAFATPARAQPVLLPALAALPPGQSTCPDPTASSEGGTQAQSVPDLAGYGASGVPSGPVFLGSGALAYLTTTRRPIPRVTGLMVRTLSGQTLWQVRLPPGTSPVNVTALSGTLAVSLRRQASAVVVERAPGTGQVVRTASLPWTGQPLAPQLTPLPQGHLLVSGSALDFASALGGLGPGAPSVWLLSSQLRRIWNAARVGRLVALGSNIAVFGDLTGPENATVQLTALSPQTGQLRWTRQVRLPATPVTATFSLTPAGNLLWSVRWSNAGQLALLAAATGHARWQDSTQRSVWTAMGTVAVGGTPPWQPALPIHVRSLATGKVLLTLPVAAVPVGEIGQTGWLSVWRDPATSTPATPTTLPGPRLFLFSLAQADAGTLPTLRPTFVSGGAPPYTLACAPSGVRVLTPWITGSLAVLGGATPSATARSKK